MNSFSAFCLPQITCTGSEVDMASSSPRATNPREKTFLQRSSTRVKDLPPWQRLKKALQVDPLDYVQSLGRLSPTARCSSLQPLLKRGQHTLSTLCALHLNMGGSQYIDIHANKNGGILPLEEVFQCHITLCNVFNIPSTGVKERKCWLNVARLCLYDGCKFFGNVQAVKPRGIRPGKEGNNWEFDPVTILVRCPQARVHSTYIYIEFNSSYELTAEEVARLPSKPERAARCVDELVAAWVLVDLQAMRTRGVVSSRNLTFPLCGGPLAHRLKLGQFLPHVGQPRPKISFFGTPVPFANIKLSHVSATDADASPLPSAIIASPGVAQVLGLYRMMLAERIGYSEDGIARIAPFTDQALASLPKLLDDPDVSAAFFALWEQQTAPLLNPTTSQLKIILQQCAAVVSLMMGSQAIPAASAANHTVHQWERKRRISTYLQLHPVVGINSDAHQWLHRPFDAAELVYDPISNLAVTV